MISIDYRTLLTIVSLSCLACGECWGAERVAASFKGGPRAFAETIEFPKVTGDIDVTLLCGAEVSSGGSIDLNTCFTNQKEHGDFETAVVAAMGSDTFDPAVFDGEKVKVWFPYSVQFLSEDEDKTIVVRPNYQLLTNRYGPSYVAPQRVIRQARRPQRAGDRYEVYITSCRLRTTLWVRADLDSDGIPRNVSFLSDTNASCRDEVRDVIEGGDYIPAYHDEQPVAAVHVEAFWRQRPPRGTEDSIFHSRILDLAMRSEPEGLSGVTAASDRE